MVRTWLSTLARLATALAPKAKRKRGRRDPHRPRFELLESRNLFDVGGPLASILGAPTLGTEGVPIALTASVSGGSPNGFTYAWSALHSGDTAPLAVGSAGTFVFIPDRGGAFNVSLTATDPLGNHYASAQSINVANVAPAVAISGAPVTAASGAALTLTSSVSDPGVLQTLDKSGKLINSGDSFTYAWSVTSNGQPVNLPSGTVTNAPSFTFTPPSGGVYVPALTVTDLDGATGSGTVTVPVTDATPVVQILNAPTGTVAEGTPLTLAGASANPAAVNALSYSWSVLKNGIAYNTGTPTSGTTFRFTPDDNGTYVVTLTSTNPATGLSGSDARTLTVTNVAPTVTIQPGSASDPALSQPRLAGAAISLRAAVSDPGTADLPTMQVQWTVLAMNGQVVSGGSGTTFAFTPSGPGSYLVTATATDKDGGKGGATQLLTVTSAAPTVAILGAPGQGLEGTPIPLSSTVSGGTGALTYAWSVTKDGAALTLPPGTVTNGTGFTFTPPDNGSYAVTLTVTDSASPTPHSVADTRTIAVQNVPPTVAIGHLPANATAPAGAEIDLSAAVADPGVNDNVTVSWRVLNAVTGQAVAPLATAVYPGGVSFVAPDAGPYLILATAQDKDGATGTAAANLTITPSGPTAAITNAPASAVEGTALALGSTVSGATGGVTYAWGVTWDALPFTLPAGTVTNAPTFTFTPTQANPLQPAPYVVTLTVTAANGSVSASQTVQVVSAKPAVTLVFAPGQTLPAPEGSPVTLSANVADPTARPALLQYAWTVTTTDPHFTLPRTTVTTAPIFTFTPTASGQSGTAYSWGVTLAVTDADGLTGTASAAVPVANVSPAVIVAPAQGAAVNTNPNTLTLNALVTDPSTEDTFTYLWSVQNATVDPASGLTGVGIVLHPTGAGPVLAAVAVTDSNGATGSAMAQVFAAAVPNDVITVSATTIGDATTTVPINPSATQLVVLALGVNNVVNASASPLPAALYGSDPLNALGQPGGDTLLAGNHGDMLMGGPGADSLVGGAGNDTFYGSAGNDTLAGGAGNDVYLLTPGGNTTVFDPSGANQLNFALAGSGITLNLNLNQGQTQAVDAAGDTVALTGNFPILVGSNFSDNLVAGSGSSVFGGGGNDTLLTTGGSNIALTAGSGSDVLLAQGGSQVTLSGGTGNDILMALGASGAALFAGGGNSTLAAAGGQNVTLYGGAGNDTLLTLGGTNDLLYGGSGNSSLTDLGGREDTLFGGAGQDTLLAEAGQDITLYGGSGRDTLTNQGGTRVSMQGGSGNDTLTANGGSEITLYGGTGNDSGVAIAGHDITLYGGTGNDTLTATNATETVLYGGEGASILRAEAGQDITLYGGDGNDTLTAVNGTGVSMHGGSGNDSLTAQGGQDITIYGGTGNDTGVAIAGHDITLYGGSGNDSLTSQGGAEIFFAGGTGQDILRAEAGQDITLYGGTGNDALSSQGGAGISMLGGSGNDTLTANGGGEITLYGGTGNDTGVAIAGQDITLYGGAGNDALTTQGSTNASVVGGTGNDTLDAQGGAEIYLDSGSGNSIIRAEAGQDITLYGGTGNDTLDANGDQGITIYGGSGQDILRAEAGQDITLYGGSGNDQMIVNTADDITLYGGTGNDSFLIEDGNGVRLYGGSGNDTLTTQGGQNINAVGGTGNDTLTANGGSEITLYGGTGNDSGVAIAGHDITLYGGTGNDTLDAQGGQDITIYGGSGQDILRAEAGQDITLYGGSGNDQMIVNTADDITLYGGTGNDSLYIENGHGASLYGGTGNDTLDANGGQDITLYGGSGQDILRAEAGQDITLFGGSGNDTLQAEGGQDITLYGGSGNDTLQAQGGGNATLTLGGLKLTAIPPGSAGNAISIALAEVDDGMPGVQVNGNYIVVSFTPGMLTSQVAAMLNGNAAAAALVSATGGNDVASPTPDFVSLSGGGGGVLNGVSLNGGSGNDTLSVQGGQNVTLNAGSGSDNVLATDSSNVALLGGTGNSTLASQGGSNVTLSSLSGNDTLSAAGGSNVTLFGGSGTDALSSSGDSAVNLYGGSGNASLSSSGDSNVNLFGGSGTDALSSSGGSNIKQFAGSGNNTLSATGGNNVTQFAGTGTSALTAQGSQNVTQFGQAGSNTLSASGGSNVTLVGGAGTTAVTSSGGSNVSLYAGPGTATLAASGGSNVRLYAGSGNDALSYSAGGDAGSHNVSLFGGAGNDALSVTGGTNVTLLAGAGNTALTSSGGTGVTLFGGPGNDTLTSTGGTNIVQFGGAGNDVLAATGGSNVTLYGGTGNDTLTSASGSNVAEFAGPQDSALTVLVGTNVALYGGAGNDTLTAASGTGLALYGGDGSDTYLIDRSGNPTAPLTVSLNEVQTVGTRSAAADFASTGTDTLRFNGLSGINLNLGLSAAQTISPGVTLTLQGPFRRVVGTPGNDTLIGNDLGDSLDGNGGNDSLVGGAGNDTLIAGAGNATLDGGAGNDTYRFTAASAGTAVITEADNPARDSEANTLDFAAFGGPVNVSLASAAAQAVSASSGRAPLTLTLADPLSIANVIGTPGNDTLTGNSRDNQITPNGGADVLSGGGGADTYLFGGSAPSSAVIHDTYPASSDSLNFMQLGGPVTLDLSQPVQNAVVSPGLLTLTLDDPMAVKNVVGSAFADSLTGNARDNVLVGMGGGDRLSGGPGGNDTLIGGVPQVVYLDFTTAANLGRYPYSASERGQIQQILQAQYGAFNFTFTQDPAQAAALAAPTGGRYVTLVFNQPPGGGQSSDLVNFRNTDLGGSASVDAFDLLGGPGAPTVAQGIIGLSAELAAHELGHLVGLRHGDAFSGYAAETGAHIMQSSAALGTTLFDAAGLNPDGTRKNFFVNGTWVPTFFGEQEDIKLAFADNGVVIPEQTAAHGALATAQPLGVLPGLAVPNTILDPKAQAYGKVFRVQAIDVLGSIQINPATGKSEDDWYSFDGKAGQVFTLQALSRTLAGNGNPMDSVLRVYDASGKLLASNDDDLDSTDSALVNLPLPADGRYYVQVDTYTPDGIHDSGTGNYELFVSSFATVPAGTLSLGTGDTLIAAAGNDTFIGSSGNDTFLAAPGVTGLTVQGGAGADALRATGISPALVQTFALSANVTVETADLTPPLLALIPNQAVMHGSVDSFTVAASDADGGDQITYSLQAAPGAAAFPQEASLDAHAGTFTWLAANAGTYTVRVVATDLAGNAVFQDVTITVS